MSRQHHAHSYTLFSSQEPVFFSPMSDGFILGLLEKLFCFTQKRDISKINFVPLNQSYLNSYLALILHHAHTHYVPDFHKPWLLSIHHPEAQLVCFTEAQTRSVASLPNHQLHSFLQAMVASSGRGSDHY